MVDEPQVGDMVDGWEVVSVYSTEQAEADGVIARVGRLTNGDAVFFTANLMAEGYEKDEEKRTELVKQGLEALRQPDREDSPFMRLRALAGGKVWVIQEARKLTFLLPSDY